MADTAYLIVIGILALGLAYFVWMYRRGVRDSVNLTNFIVLILLSDKDWEIQAKALLQFVKTANYREPAILSGMVSMGLSDIAASQAWTLGLNIQRLWNLNQNIDEGGAA